jgi:hypothetical protein
MASLPTPDDAAVSLLVSLLYRPHKTATYEQAFSSAFATEVPALHVSLPLVEDAVGRLLGKGLVSHTGSGLTVSDGLWAAADAAAMARGGWLTWFRTSGIDGAGTPADDTDDGKTHDPEQWYEEYDTRADLIEEAYRLAAGKPVPFAFPSTFVVPRKEFIDDAGPGLAAVVGGVVAVIAAPLLVVGGIGWTVFSAARFAFQRGSGRI